MVEEGNPYLRRSIEKTINRKLEKFPAVLLRGTRGVGKTTTAKAILAESPQRTLIDLSVPSTLLEFKDRSHHVLENYQPPMIIDEWQLSPDILWAVKRWVDNDFTPGQFVILGSVSGQILQSTAPLTGRSGIVDMYPLTQSEISQTHTTPLIDRLLGDVDLGIGCAPMSKEEYIEIAVKGGLPRIALGDPDRYWEFCDAYLEHVFSRADFGFVMEKIRPSVAFRNYVNAYAAYSGKVAEAADINQLANVSAPTGRKHLELLQGLMLVEQLPGWLDNRFNQLRRMPKRLLTDSGLMAYMENLHSFTLGLTPSKLGPLLETFVAAQLRPEAGYAENRFKMHHLRRNKGDREIDIILETRTGELVGIEITASGHPGRDKIKHLKWFQEIYPNHKVYGVLLHTGEECKELDDRIFTAPISTLWADNSDIRS